MIEQFWNISADQSKPPFKGGEKEGERLEFYKKRLNDAFELVEIKYDSFMSRKYDINILEELSQEDYINYVRDALRLVQELDKQTK